MKQLSFRLRIALLSTLLAGSALAGFGFISCWLIYKAKLKLLDSDITSQLQRESAPPKPETYWKQPETYWKTYEEQLPFIFKKDADSIALLVIQSDRERQKVYQSKNWPSHLNRTSLFPSEPLLALPPPPHPDWQPPPPTSGQEPPLGQGQKNFPEDLPRRPPKPPPEGLPFGTSEFPESLREPVIQPNTGEWRVGAATTPFVRIAIAVKLKAIDRDMNTIRSVFVISIPLVLSLVAIGAWGLSGSALEPLHKVTATIRRVTAKGLDQRIPTTGVDVEFVELLQVFNQMMERLERSFNQASRFSADAAHELKTPLAILQGELERTLQQVDRGSELQQRLSHLLDEVCRLSSIVRKLLLLSLADAGQMRLHRVEVDLSQLLTDLADDIEMLAPELDVQVQIAPGLRVKGDRDLLIQVLQNLIGNAIKYNLPGGWVGIDAQRKGTTVSVTVSNRSNDIPANEREQIFERFHRGDPARTRNVEGLGLGLSLSREIARAHSGALKLDHTPPGQTAFTLTLPIGLC